MKSCHIFIEDPVFYTLGLAPTFDYYEPSSTAPARRCGDNGYKSGLDIHFSTTELGNIPLRQSVEVDIAVYNNMRLCFDYKEVELRLIATCEIPTAFSVGVYQYGVQKDSDGLLSIDYDAVLGPLQEFAYFGASWEENSASMQEMADQISELKLMLESLSTAVDAVSVETTAISSNVEPLSKDVEDLEENSTESSGYANMMLVLALGLLVLLIFLVIVVLVVLDHMRSKLVEAPRDEKASMNDQLGYDALAHVDAQRL